MPSFPGFGRLARPIAAALICPFRKNRMAQGESSSPRSRAPLGGTHFGYPLAENSGAGQKIVDQFTRDSPMPDGKFDGIRLKAWRRDGAEVGT